ncbi:MAG: flagellar hook-associated protein 2 [Clostridiales bacterium]|jgi:flagellar hook-associated protein 2|nr:flagellar hook-associated protein 2 [Clostridiales bacterium]
MGGIHMRVTSNTLRLTGLATGIDTDEMIRKLMEVENMRADKLRQEIQLLEWKRDNYREITNLLRGFKDEYFDVLKPNTNFRSATAFSAFEAVSSNESVLTAAAGSSAVPGTYDINVTALAKIAAKTSASEVSKGYAGVTGTNAVDLSAMKKGKEFKLTLDGVSKIIKLDADYIKTESVTSEEALQKFEEGLQKLVDAAFGSGKITVSESGGKLTFTPATLSSTLSVDDSTNTYLSTLGFSNGQNNMITSSADITDFSGGNFKISIDGGAAIDINVASAAARDELVTNINTALTGAGLDATVQAVKDPDNTERIKFVTLDTTKKATFTSGDADDMLAKVNISSGSAINAMNGTIDYSTDDTGKEFNINIDGISYKIDLTKDYADGDDALLETEINNQLSTAKAPGDVSVNISGGKISFSSTSAHRITMETGDAGLRDELGFSSTQNSSRINLDNSLETISSNLATAFTFDESDKMTFTINGVTIEANKTDTMNDVIDKINTSNAGVKLRYDSLIDKFTLETKDTGATAVIDNTDVSGNFFAVLNIDTSAQARGTDASLTIDSDGAGGQDPVVVTRSTNKFTINDITYDLKATGTSTVTISPNADDLVEKIKGFVNKYNEVIVKINEELSEKRYRDYPPLTDAQKDEMTEREIELWEEKAKSGILRSDPILQKIVNSMRRALYDAVEGVDLNLYEIGITTSSIYQNKGQLVIDEEKLRKAIEDNPDKVTQLFTKESSYDYSDSANRAARYNEEGLAQRLYDIIQDNIRFTRDANGKKGILLEKAGIEGDLTEFQNIMNTQIDAQNNRLDRLLDSLTDKENYYYSMFARMESAIQSMNAQSAWLMAQTGMGT